MHHGTCMTHEPWCMSGSLPSGFLWTWWRGKHSRHTRRMRNPQFYVSGKRPIDTNYWEATWNYRWWQYLTYYNSHLKNFINTFILAKLQFDSNQLTLHFRPAAFASGQVLVLECRKVKCANFISVIVSKSLTQPDLVMSQPNTTPHSLYNHDKKGPRVDLGRLNLSWQTMGRPWWGRWKYWPC